MNDGSDSPTSRSADPGNVLSRRDLAGWSFTAGFFVGVLLVTWFDVLVGLRYDAVSAAIVTVLIVLLAALGLYRDVDRAVRGDSG
jgi:apolipoprotein N-acyltransferase